METLEKKFVNIGGVLVLEDDTKSQQSYSEEEVLEFANWCRIQDNKYPNRVINIQQLFKQFKKI